MEDVDHGSSLIPRHGHPHGQPVEDTDFTPEFDRCDLLLNAANRRSEGGCVVRQSCEIADRGAEVREAGEEVRAVTRRQVVSEFLDPR